MSSDRNSRVMPPPRAATNTGTTTASTTASTAASTAASTTTPRPAGSSHGGLGQGGARSQRPGTAPTTGAANDSKRDSKRDLRVVTTSIESCREFHRKFDYHPATLLFKTYGVLATSPEMSSRGSRSFVAFDLCDGRSRVNLACYFLQSERRLPNVRLGQNYTVVGHFLKENDVGDFKVLTINEAMPDNGVRQNLFNYNDQKMRESR